MATKQNILIIDDEEDIRSFLSVSLTNAGYKVQEARDGQEALKWVESRVPELIILDLGLPDKDGKDVLGSIRKWSSVPVIILSARDQETEKVEALDIGADDYLTKPFGIAELLARIKVALRHASRIEGKTDNIYRHLDLEIDPDKRRVILAGQEVHLTPTEYKLLAALALQPGKVVTQSALINSVWGKHAQGHAHYLRIYVQHLREKLKDDPLRPRFILTEPGGGYRLAIEI